MDIQPIFRCAVGMDVHLAVIHVGVILQEPGCEPAVYRRRFGAFQRDRRAMAEWIAGFAPDTGVMESTGIYWKSPYAALEQVGIRALVVNAQHVQKVPGRKTDTSDAEWLAMSDPHGVAARALIDCLLQGGTPEQALRYAGRLKAPREELLASLQGKLSEEHLFVARLIRPHIDTLETQLADLEHRLFDQLKPYEAAVQLLLTIPGIDRLSAAKLLVEIGVDRAAFGTADRLSKWAGVCPGNHESAGKRKRGQTAPGKRYVRTVLCEIAWAATRTTSQFKSKFQGLVIRRGTKRAIIALAHKVLKTVFVLLSRQVPYRDSTVDYEALGVKRNAPRWIRQLKKFGYLPKTA
jgi:transposase